MSRPMTETERLKGDRKQGLGEIVAEKIAKAVRKARVKEAPLTAQAKASSPEKKAAVAVAPVKEQFKIVEKVAKPKSISIDAALGKGGALHELKISSPKDPELVGLLSEVVRVREAGGDWTSTYQRFQQLRWEKNLVVSEEAQSIHDRLWLLSRKQEVNPGNLTLAAMEGVGSPRRAPRSGVTSVENSFSDVLDGLDAHIDHLPAKLNQRIQRLKNLNTGPSNKIREGEMDQAIRDLENLLRNEPDVTTENDWTINEIKTRFNQRRNQIEAVAEKRERIPSRLYLSPELAIQGLNDQIGTADVITDDLLIQIFKGAGQSPLADTALERLKNLEYVLFDPSFVEKRAEMFYPDGTTPWTDEEMRRVLEARKKFDKCNKTQKERFARSFNIRFKAAQFFEKWKDAAALNEKEYQRYVNERMDEDDFFGLDAQYGALVGRFRRSLAKNYSKYIFDEHRQRRGMDPHWWDDAMRDTITEMQGNKRNFQRYKKYREGEFFKDRPGSTIEEATLRPFQPVPEDKLKEEYDEACKAIANLANVRMIMSFEKFNIDARFAPPKWSQSHGDIPSDFLEKQKGVRLVNPYENHLMQWNTFGTEKTEYERANIRHRAEIWLETMPEARKFGDELGEEMWERIIKFKDGTLPTEDERILFGDVDCLFYFKPDPLNRPPDPLKESTEMGLWIRKLSKERLQEEAQIYTGMRLSQRFDINPYFVMFESGYRKAAENFK